jgi:acetyl esterase/lipase
VDVSDLADPEIAAMLAALPTDVSAMRLDDVPTIRALSAQMFADLPPSAEVSQADRSIPGEPDVTVRVYQPRAASDELRPALYWIHGGGYMIGSYLMNGPQLSRWCELFDCVAVSVEYRLAPEHTYPAALEDCCAGLRWTYEHADELGIDRNRIGIGGASAGGGLAACTALLARDTLEIPLDFQLLIYPMLDDRRISVSSQWETLIWTPRLNAMGWQAYLGSVDAQDVPAYAAAARATDLSGLPPTLILVGAIDGFLDEDVAYAQRLLHSRVPTELHVYAGAPHAFDSLAAGTVVAQQAAADIERWLRARLCDV